ncbi:MAG: methyltransferase domain-containing protein, partial [Patescibacteria group bacterium]
RGKYLLYLDADHELTPEVLSQCAMKASKRARAIITPKKEVPGGNFWSKCRALERSLFWKEKYLESPDFIEKALFESIGGFNEKLDPMDDWDLQLTLREKGEKFGRIKTPILVRESTIFRQMLKKKYERGRIFPAFKNQHSYVPLINPKIRFGSYFKNWKKFIKQPHLTVGLFILKAGDVVSFFLGTLNSREKEVVDHNLYSLPKIAEEYDQKRLGNNFGRYKHYAEIRSLFKLLLKKKLKILEVGAGTGRITQELIKKGYKLYPLDISEAMLEQYKKKKGLPKALLLKNSQFPFKDSSFEVVLSVRVFWHINHRKERGKFLQEAARTTSKFVILDIVNRQRFLGKLLINRQTYSTTLFEFKARVRKYGLNIDSVIPLDVCLPVWLNLLPRRTSTKLFPLLYQLDLTLAKLIPPGRYLLKLSKS